MREDRPEHKRLVAYYVAENASIIARSLRDQLALALPDFMVPAIYIALDALPVTANGKLDRRALPAPDNRRPELADVYIPAVGAKEQRLCDLFADVLGLDQVGRIDHFFDLGGNSLLLAGESGRVSHPCGTVISGANHRGLLRPSNACCYCKHDRGR